MSKKLSIATPKPMIDKNSIIEIYSKTNAKIYDKFKIKEKDMKLKYLEKFKTDETMIVNHPLVGSQTKEDSTVDIKHNVYEGQLFVLIGKYMELKQKQKFYKSWKGRVFFNGSYNIIDVEYNMAKLEEMNVLYKFID